MKDRELEKMQLDDLWDLHQRIIEVLDCKLEEEKQKLQRQLDELGRKFGGSPKDIPQRRPSLGIQPATIRGLDTHASAGHRLKIGKVCRNGSNTHTI
jgi:hypothetical protein